MRIHFLFQIVTLFPLIFAGLLNGLASAQFPAYDSLDNPGDQRTAVHQEFFTGTGCICACRCPPLHAHRCGLMDLRNLGTRSCSFAHPETMPQRYPYMAIQMSYYARPYNAAYNTSNRAPNYSDSVFAAATLEVESVLPVDANLEYADAPRSYWPNR